MNAPRYADVLVNDVNTQREHEMEAKPILEHSEDAFQITEGNKWWTAARKPSGLWFVMNWQGRALKQGTELHQRIVRAVENGIWHRAVVAEIKAARNE